MDILDILTIDGIVVRLIPKYSTSKWFYREGQVLKPNEELIEENGRKFVKEVRENKLYGYVVTIQRNQDTQVRFSRELSGFGDTVENAYRDYLSKN